ncbi:MAG: YfcE family phosphodiesterase [Flavobacteriales bacterium]|nr:YfcE family phosphodiesterase [Flavobacteriales bacterium]|tara:strand:- start:445 stop:936 length:492 start_codon:yes stop_codon:yes gene_type:complete
MKKIVLLSDTHNSLDTRIIKHLKKSDEIWHAGDIGSFEIIDKLSEYAPTTAVFGNIDNAEIRKSLKKTITFKCEEIKILMTHIGGYPGNYNHEIQDILKKNKPNIFISGHSHILKVIFDKKYNLLHMNPGAIGDYGIHKFKTIICFNITLDKIHDLRVIQYER